MRTPVWTVLAVALIASGCASTEAPTQATSATPHTTASAEHTAGSSPTVGQTISVPPGPAPTLPAMPPEAQEMTNEGAAAFVIYWFDLANYAQQTGDTGPMMALTGPECSSCERIRQQIASGYSENGRVVDNLWTLSESTVTIRRNLIFGVQITFSQTRGYEIATDGQIRRILPEDHKTLVAVLRYQEGGWSMAGLANP